MNEVLVSQAELADLSDEFLGRGESFRFRAKGFSMFPFLRDGDVITVKRVNPETIGVGDICMFLRGESQPVVHRITGRDTGSHGLTFRAQGDMLFGQDEIVCSDRILGKAVVLIRNGQTVQLDTWSRRVAVYLWYEIRVLVWLALALKRVLRSLALKTLEGIQACTLYRRVARKLINRRVNCRPLVPGDADKLSQVYWTVPSPRKMLESLGKRELIAGAIFGSRLVGAITLSPLDEGTDPGGDMLLSGLYVRRSFRGMGVGERLVRMAIDKADQQGAKRVRCLVFEDNEPALRLYRKMEFQTLAGETEPLEGNKRRIVMSREILFIPPSPRGFGETRRS